VLQSNTRAERSRREFNPQTRCSCVQATASTKRDSRLTVRLKNDHKAIVRDLERLSTKAKLEVRDRSGEAMLFTSLRESLNDHFRREEQILFPLLSRSLGSAVCDKLNNEHAEMLRIAKLTEQTISFEEHVAQLKQLFHAHMSIEENVLLWYLDVQQPSG